MSFSYSHAVPQRSQRYLVTVTSAPPRLSWRLAPCTSSGCPGALRQLRWMPAHESHSPYLDALPVLSLQREQLSNYKLRRSQRDEAFCTSEVAALCLALAGEAHAAQTLEAYLDVFTNHYLHAKQQQPVDAGDAAHLRLRALAAL